MTTTFPFEPNWQGGIDVSRSYKTEIITSRDLSEQRKALRQEPRRVFDLAVMTSKYRAEDAWAYLAAHGQDEFIMPDPTRSAETNIAAPVNSRELSITGAANIPWLKVGATVMVGATARKTLPTTSYAKEVGSDWKYRVEPAGSAEDYSGIAYDDTSWDVSAGGFGQAFDG